jgi:anti-sigma regulatory factor (Ser/Thr protein kinase)
MPYHRCPSCGVTSYSAAAHSTVGVCPSCATPLADHSRVVVVPGAKHDLSRRLRARPQAAAEGRRAVATLALPEPTRQTLALLVSEFVTNSVVHAGLATDDTIELHINNGGPQVRVTVHDRGPGFTPTVPSADPLQVGAQGLVLAAALSEAWGVDCDQHGCTVWADIATEEHPAAAIEHEVTSAYVRDLAIEMASGAAVASHWGPARPDPAGSHADS